MTWMVLEQMQRFPAPPSEGPSRSRLGRPTVAMLSQAVRMAHGLPISRSALRRSGAALHSVRIIHFRDDF